MGFTRLEAGRGGRSDTLGFTSPKATAVRKGAPGNLGLGFTWTVAGRGGRSVLPGFSS